MKHSTSAAIFLLFSSQVALGNANKLAGNYTLSAPCQFTNKSLGTVTIPAGSILVSENIPVNGTSLESPSVSPGIIFQAAGDFHSVLTLRVGNVTRFAFGIPPFSLGTYSENGATFLEQFGTSESKGAVDSSIKIERNTYGLEVSSLDQAGNEIGSCYLTQSIN